MKRCKGGRLTAVRLLRFELYKIGGRRGFLVFLAAMLGVNLFLLWYTGRPSAGEPAPAAYRALSADLQGKTKEQKRALIEEAYEQAEAFALIAEIETARAQDTREGDALAARLLSEQPDLYERYREKYDAGARPRYAADLTAERRLLSDIRGELIRCEGYDSYLDGIEQRARRLSGVSIFASGDGGESFSSRNIRRTAEDYAGMRGVTLSFDVSRGFEEVTGFLPTDVLALLLLFALSAVLIFGEKQRNLFLLTRPTGGGRTAALAAKVLAMAVSAAGVVLLLYGSSLLYEAAASGLGDLGRSLQSVSAFFGSPLRISAGEYLLLYLGTKWVSCAAAGLLTLLAAVFFRRPAAAFALLAAVFGCGFALSALIPSSSVLAPLKYLNPAAALQVNQLYGQYLNLAVFGRPVGLIPLFFLFLALLIVLLTAALFLTFHRRRDFSAGGGRRLPIFGRRGVKKTSRGTGLWAHEGYKLFIRGRALLFLLLYVGLTVLILPRSPGYLPPEEIRYQRYMERLAGELTPEKERFLEEEQRAMAQAEEGLSALQEQVEEGELTQLQASQLGQGWQTVLSRRPALLRALEQAERIRERPGTRFVYETGLTRLATGAGSAAAVLPALLSAVLCFSPLFASEFASGAERLLFTTPRGRRDTAAVKLKLCALVSLPLGVLPLVSLWWSNLLTYGLSDLSVSAASLEAVLPGCAGLPVWVPSGALPAAQLLLSVFNVLCVSLAAGALSLRLRNTILTLLAGVLLFGAPVLLEAMGLSAAGWFSVLPAFRLGRALAGGFPLTVFALYEGGLLLAGGVSIGYGLRRFRPVT